MAQEDFVPLSLRDVNLQKSTVSWADVGGLFPEVRMEVQPGLMRYDRIEGNKKSPPGVANEICSHLCAVTSPPPFWVRYTFLVTLILMLVQTVAVRVPWVWKDHACLCSS